WWPFRGSYNVLGMSTHTERCVSRKSSGRYGQGIRLNQVNFMALVVLPPPAPCAGAGAAGAYAARAGQSRHRHHLTSSGDESTRPGRESAPKHLILDVRFGSLFACRSRTSTSGGCLVCALACRNGS